MFTNKSFLRFLRWSSVIGGLILLFWTVFYLVAGYVPVVDKISISPNEWLRLPFSISRWWDFLLAPLYIAVFIFLFPKPRTETSEIKSALLSIACLLFIVTGIASILFGLVYCLFGALSVLILLILKYRLVKKFWDWLIVQDA